MLVDCNFRFLPQNNYRPLDSSIISYRYEDTYGKMLVSGWFSVHCILLRGSSVDCFGQFATIIENRYFTTELGLNLAGSQCGQPCSNIAKTANIRERGHYSRTGPITGISAFLWTQFYRRHRCVLIIVHFQNQIFRF